MKGQLTHGTAVGFSSKSWTRGLTSARALIIQYKTKKINTEDRNDPIQIHYVPTKCIIYLYPWASAGVRLYLYEYLCAESFVPTPIPHANHKHTPQRKKAAPQHEQTQSHSLQHQILEYMNTRLTEQKSSTNKTREKKKKRPTTNAI